MVDVVNPRDESEGEDELSFARVSEESFEFDTEGDSQQVDGKAAYESKSLERKFKVKATAV